MKKNQILSLSAFVLMTAAAEAATVYEHRDIYSVHLTEHNRPTGTDIIFMSHDVASDAVRNDVIDDARFFSDLQILQYYDLSDRSKGLPFFINQRVWESSSLAKVWSDFVSEKNAFTRKKMEAEFWDKLDSLYESEWPSIYEEAKNKTLVFGARVKKSKEFDFDKMSKTISANATNSVEMLHGIRFPKRCVFAGDTLTKGTGNFVGLNQPIVLPPTSGPLLESLSDIDDPLPCSPTFTFNSSEDAERFEDIVTSKAPILFYFTRLKSLETDGRPVVAVEKVELWAQENGDYEPTGFSLSIDESLTYDEYVQQLVDLEIQNRHSSDKNLPKDHFFESENIFSNGNTFVQFFDGGQEMYLRKNSFVGGGMSLGRYVAETVNGRPVFRLDGADGQEATSLPQSIYFPEPDAPYGGQTVILGLGYTMGFTTLYNGQLFTGNLRSDFLSNR